MRLFVEGCWKRDVEIRDKFSGVLLGSFNLIFTNRSWLYYLRQCWWIHLRFKHVLSVNLKWSVMGSSQLPLRMSGQEEKGSKFVVVVVQSSMHGIVKPVFSVCVVVGYILECGEVRRRGCRVRKKREVSLSSSLCKAACMGLWNRFSVCVSSLAFIYWGSDSRGGG